MATKKSKGADLHEPSLDEKNGAATRTWEPYTVDVTIEGVAPMLFHRYDVEDVEMKAKAKKGSAAKKEDNLESFLYRDSKNRLCVPGLALKAAIREAARRVPDPSSPRRSARDLFRAAIMIEPYMVPLLPERTEWDSIDVRPVLVQRARVTRRRPMVEEWKLSFQIIVADPEFIDKELLYNVLQMAGRFQGLLDFRPDFGRFNITRFEKVDFTKAA